MNCSAMDAFKPCAETLARTRRILPGAAATAVLWMLAATCREPGVTEAAFPLLFLPVLSITSFVMAFRRAHSLVGTAAAGAVLRICRSVATAAAAESLPFVVFFSGWNLSWMPFLVGVFMASATGGLAGLLAGTARPEGKATAAAAAVFLQLPSMAGFALFRHPLLLLLPNQGALEMLDGAFGPLLGAEMMLPLVSGAAWISIGTLAASITMAKRSGKGKGP